MQFYLNCSRELSRLEGVVRSPMINTLNEVTAGADTIRGYRLQKENCADRYFVFARRFML